MAKQQTGGSPNAAGQEQQSRSGTTGSTSGSTTGGTTGGYTPGTSDVAAAGAMSGSVQGADARSDQERQRQVTREGGAGPGTGMQRGRQPGAGTGVTGRGQAQPSLLPAFMSSPGLMASAFMSNPFAFAQAMSQEMDRLFGAFGSEDLASPYAQGAAGRGLASTGQAAGRGMTQWTPQMEAFQRGNELVVRADLPGLKPDEVQIDVEDGVLTISGERRESSEDRREGWYRSERSYGAFSRSIALPEGVDEDQVNARYEQGVLEVTVPLPQQQRPRARRVQIQAGAPSSQQPQSPRQSPQQSTQQPQRADASRQSST